MIDEMTPREYAAGKHSPAFGFYRLPDFPGAPRTLGRGLVAFTDADAKRSIWPGMVIGIEEMNGRMSICTYWHDDHGEPKKRASYDRPYTRQSLVNLVGRKKIIRTGICTYDEIRKRYWGRYPGQWFPARFTMAEQWGLTEYDID